MLNEPSGEISENAAKPKTFRAFFAELRQALRRHWMVEFFLLAPILGLVACGDLDCEESSMPKKTFEKLPDGTLVQVPLELKPEFALTYFRRGFEPAGKR